MRKDSILIEYEDIRGVIHRERVQGDFSNSCFVEEQVLAKIPDGMKAHASVLVTYQLSRVDSPMFEHYRFKLLSE